MSVPHLHTPPTQVFEIDRSHRDVPQTHWHIPYGCMTSDLASNPAVHVTIAHGAKLGIQNNEIMKVQEQMRIQKVEAPKVYIIDVLLISILPHGVDVWHISCSVNDPLHSFPLFSSLVLMVLILTLNPSPQVLLHVDHVSHSSQTQSTK